MSYKLLDMMILFLTLMIVGSATAFPVDYSSESIENFYVNTALEYRNKNSPIGYSYRSRAPVACRKVEGDAPVMKISVLQNPDCINKASCPSEPNDNHIYSRLKREATNVDVYDKIIQNFITSGIQQLNKTKKFTKRVEPVMINATKEDTPDGAKYVIYFFLAELKIITRENISVSIIGGGNPARLCTMNVDETNKSTTAITQIDVTCEKNQHPLVFRKDPVDPEVYDQLSKMFNMPYESLVALFPEIFPPK